MKGIVIEQTAYASVTDWAHRCGQKIKRIIIPELDNLAITLHEEQIFVTKNHAMKDNCEKIKEVDVPDELVEQALQYLKVQNDFFSHKDSFQSFL